ncbi:MAG: sigma-70 family RNA polymerase sigma factor [Mariniblastus sp.]
MDSATRAYKQNTSIDQLREQLIMDNLVYVRKILSTLTVGLPPNFDRENLEQAGIVGLVETARSFDPNRGIAFRTYCYPRIRGAIVDEMRKNSPVPQQMLARIKEVKAAYERLESPVTPEQLANETGMPVETIVQVLEAMRFSKPQNWNDLFFYLHSGWRSGESSPGHEIETRELKQVLADCIERLPERERLVLTLYFIEDLTLSEIGEVIGISESRASRNLAAAKFRLKELVHASI